MNDALKEFLAFIRTNPNFPALLKAVEQPRISPFRVSEAEQSEKARSKWIFESGKLHQDNAWRALLTGKPTSDGDT